MKGFSLKNYIVYHGLVVNIIIGFFMNLLINGFIGWCLFAFNKFNGLPMYGKISIHGDLIGMSVTLTAIVAWLNITTAREELKVGIIETIERPKHLLGLLYYLPHSRVLRVILLTTLFTFFAFPTTYLLEHLNITKMSGLSFILFKAFYGGILAVFVIFVTIYSVMVKGK